MDSDPEEHSPTFEVQPVMLADYLSLTRTWEIEELRVSLISVSELDTLSLDSYMIKLPDYLPHYF